MQVHCRYILSGWYVLNVLCCFTLEFWPTPFVLDMSWGHVRPPLFHPSFSPSQHLANNGCLHSSAHWRTSSYWSNFFFADQSILWYNLWLISRAKLFKCYKCYQMIFEYILKLKQSTSTLRSIPWVPVRRWNKIKPTLGIHCFCQVPLPFPDGNFIPRETYAKPTRVRPTVEKYVARQT